MTKAAAVYCQAMTVYQTPTTDFTDHADALKASCVDLIGAPLKELSTAQDDSTRRPRRSRPRTAPRSTR